MLFIKVCFAWTVHAYRAATSHFFLIVEMFYFAQILLYFNL